MDLLTTLGIALGLAMDCFAVAVTSGITIKSIKINHALRIAFFFGFFQAMMPLLGWLAGLSLIKIISGIDHWIAFGLLSIIGCKMIYESTKINPTKKIDPLNLHVLIMLSIATSIDALAVGVTFAFLKTYILTAVLIIGLVTFLISLIGIFIGKKGGHFFENKIEVIGGLILIGIGVKILFEHLLFG